MPQIAPFAASGLGLLLASGQPEKLSKAFLVQEPRSATESSCRGTMAIIGRSGCGPRMTKGICVNKYSSVQLTMIMRIHWKTPSRVVSQEMAGMADYERLVRERKEPRQQ